MKFNHILYLSLLIIFLLSMNFIAAQEVNETDLSENNLEIECSESDLLSNDLNKESDNLNLGEMDDSNELSADDWNHIYVSPNGTGNGSSEYCPADFKQTLSSIGDNTVVHMLDGNYTWKSTGASDYIKISNKNNIMVIADHPGKVFLNSTYSTSQKSQKPEYDLNTVTNITFKNIIFHSSPFAKSVFSFKSSEKIFFENCKFVNYIKTTKKYSFILQLDSTNTDISIINCSFINSSISSGLNLIHTCLFKNCTFENCTSPNALMAPTGNIEVYGCIFINNSVVPFSILNTNIALENNYVDAKYIALIREGSNGGITSPTTLTVLNNTQLTATSGEVINITAVLVDDMGNYINIPKIDFSIEGVTYSATYKDGVYSVAYTVPEVTQPEEISIDSTPESTYLGDLTVKYQPLFLLAKPALNMTMSNVSDSVYGDNVTVKVNISNLESGNLIYQFIKDDVVVKTVTDSFSNNMSTVSVNDLPAGDYTVAVKYVEDDNFGATTITKTFTVSKANSTVQILIDPTIPVGDNITVQAIVPANAGGNVTFRLNTDNKTVNVTDKAVFDGLANGTYIIYAVYNGDDNYNPSEEVNVTFEVVKVNPTINIEYSTPVINENVTVTVTMNEDINGDVNVTINKLDPVVEHVVNGTLVFNITNVPYGPQNITVSFTSNDKYNAGEKNASFFVNKLDVDLSISADEITYGDPLVVIVNTNEKFTGEVIVKIGTLNQTVNVVNGKGNATFNNLTADDYFINATFTEDETFYADSANTTATVKGVEVPADTALNINVPDNSKSPTFSIKLDKDATGNFTVTVDGKVIDTKELKDGAASITVADLPAGDHNITISYSGDGKYAPIVQNTTLTIKEPVKPTPKVTKKATKIVAKKKTFKAKVKVKKYTITLKSGKTLLKKVKVTLKVKGKTYTATTNNKGKATFKIKNLKKKGTYKAVIKFKGNKNYKASSKKVKIKVKK